MNDTMRDLVDDLVALLPAGFMHLAEWRRS